MTPCSGSPRRRRAAALAAVLAVGALSACSATTVTGTAQRDPRLPKDAVIPALLATGNYPTTPQADLGKAGDAYKGGMIESRRLTENLVMPFEVDPALSQVGMLETGVIKNTEAMVRALPESMLKDFKTNFIAGFTVLADSQTVAQADGNYKSLKNTVVRLASPADATAAVADLVGRSAVMKTIGDTVARSTTPIPLPRHAESRAVTYVSGPNNVVFAYTAHGPYLLMQQTLTRGGAAASAELAAATLDKQIPLIDKFEPTPADKLADLPVDPDGLLARTLPPEDKSVNNGLYGPHGSLAFSSDPAADQKLLTDAGVDQVARSADTVYRAKDPAAAAQIAGASAAAVAKLGFVPSGGVPGLPAARCFSKSDSRGVLPSLFYCAVSADRYSVEVSAAKEAMAHQQISAQYLLLTAK